MDAVKLIVVFVLIVVALRRKISVGVTLFGAGLAMGLLYWLPVAELLNGYWELIKSAKFISLTSVIVLITILGALLKELQFLDNLSQACRYLHGGNRTAAAVLPGFVGLMPMPGGALLSAPLVENVLGDGPYSGELKTTINYWFRHVFEFFWPIYPGLILTEAITGLPIYKVSLLQFPLSVAMVVIGVVFFLRQVHPAPKNSSDVFRAIKGIISTIWPILIAIGFYTILKIELSLSVLLALVILILVGRPTRAALVKSVKTGLSFKLVFMVFGILSFQTVLELTGAIDSITKLATVYHLPEELIIFLVCFSAGILTGMVAAYVGLGYTLLAGFLYQPVIVPSHIFLAYFSGYLGMFLSPTHLCLILSNEYFKADLWKVFRMLAVPVAILTASGALIYLSGWGKLF